MLRFRLKAALLGFTLVPVVAPAATFKTVYKFSQLTDSYGWFAVAKDGTMYGSGSTGGTTGDGTLFKFDPNSKQVTTLYNFQGGSDGIGPVPGIALSSSGILYGATKAGGPANDGTVFQFDTKTGLETVLHGFTGSDGQTPQYGPVLGSNSVLYGTTSKGGASDVGVVYKLDERSGVEATVFTFDGNNGANPNALTVAPSGLLYATSQGGGINFGNLFTLDPSTGTQTILYSFSDEPAGEPQYNVILAQSGLIYGLGTGDAFQYNPTTGVLADLGAYGGGPNPTGPLVVDESGNLYGVDNDGVFGQVFQFNISTQESVVLYSFRKFNKGCPEGVVFGKKGDLYGTTICEGTKKKPGYGTIFSVSP